MSAQPTRFRCLVDFQPRLQFRCLPRLLSLGPNLAPTRRSQVSSKTLKKRSGNSSFSLHQPPPTQTSLKLTLLSFPSSTLTNPPTPTLHPHPTTKMVSCCFLSSSQPCKESNVRIERHQMLTLVFPPLFLSFSSLQAGGPGGSGTGVNSGSMMVTMLISAFAAFGGICSFSSSLPLSFHSLPPLAPRLPWLRTDLLLLLSVRIRHWIYLW